MSFARTAPLLAALLGWVACTHIISLDRDFARVLSDDELAQHVAAITRKLKTFKIPVHPRVRLFYRLLQKSIAAFTGRHADSFYTPHKYRGDDQGNKKVERFGDIMISDEGNRVKEKPSGILEGSGETKQSEGKPRPEGGVLENHNVLRSKDEEYSGKYKAKNKPSLDAVDGFVDYFYEMDVEKTRNVDAAHPEQSDAPLTNNSEIETQDSKYENHSIEIKGYNDSASQIKVTYKNYNNAIQENETKIALRNTNLKDATENQEQPLKLAYDTTTNHLNRYSTDHTTIEDPPSGQRETKRKITEHRNENFKITSSFKKPGYNVEPEELDTLHGNESYHLSEAKSNLTDDIPDVEVDNSAHDVSSDKYFKETTNTDGIIQRSNDKLSGDNKKLGYNHTRRADQVETSKGNIKYKNNTADNGQLKKDNIKVKVLENNMMHSKHNVQGTRQRTGILENNSTVQAHDAAQNDREHTELNIDKMKKAYAARGSRRLGGG